jgi:ATP-dependent DNA helicase DinG
VNFDLQKLVHECFPFDTMRPLQEEAITAIVSAYYDQKKRFVVLEGPTGVGKSVLAYTAMKVLEKLYTQKTNFHPFSTAIVQSRMLQTQYAKSFEDIASVWSAEHYTCNLLPTEEDAYYGNWNCEKSRCPLYKQCDYVVARGRFFGADVGVSNYSWFMLNPDVRSLVVVVDEAHNLESALCDWVTVDISDKFVKAFLAQLYGWGVISQEDFHHLNACVDFLIELTDDYDTWLEDLRTVVKEFAEKIHSIVYILGVRLDETRYSGTADKVQSSKYVRHQKFFRNLLFRVEKLAELKTDWVIASKEKSKDGKHTTVKIKPLDIREISNMLYEKGIFFLLMSATICDHRTMTKYLGIDPSSYSYIQLPNRIPPSQRPVKVITNLGDFTYKTKKDVMPIFVEFMDRLISTKYQKDRGIIHSVSYEYAEFIKEHSKLTERMLFPVSSELVEVISMLEYREDAIVVSPSVVEGLDLKDDLCRFLIFFKIPWANLGDKWVKTKSDDSDWYARDAVIRLVQGSGRGIRSETDHAITYVLDSKFLSLWGRHKNTFPKWFRDAVEFCSTEDF